MFLCSLGEFFEEEPLEGLCWASFFVGPSGDSWCWANFVSSWYGPSALLPGFYRLWEPQPGPAGFGTASRPVAVGVFSIRSWRALYAQRVAALMMQLPPSHIGELVV